MISKNCFGIAAGSPLAIFFVSFMCSFNVVCFSHIRHSMVSLWRNPMRITQHAATLFHNSLSSPEYSLLRFGKAFFVAPLQILQCSKTAVCQWCVLEHFLANRCTKYCTICALWKAHPISQSFPSQQNEKSARFQGLLLGQANCLLPGGPTPWWNAACRRLASLEAIRKSPISFSKCPESFGIVMT